MKNYFLKDVSIVVMKEYRNFLVYYSTKKSGNASISVLAHLLRNDAKEAYQTYTSDGISTDSHVYWISWLVVLNNLFNIIGPGKCSMKLIT